MFTNNFGLLLKLYIKIVCRNCTLLEKKILAFLGSKKPGLSYVPMSQVVLGTWVKQLSANKLDVLFQYDIL